ncbi:MAG: DUF3501 family protein [Gammaproteobacteria bacterium]|nr:DUF3501 family protein [Gammaproteobacteria bacterium]
MDKLARSNLWGLEAYAVQRPSFRRQVIAHKRHRRVSLNAHATLYFEDFLTMKYQVQEMLRVERIFEPAEIEAEIEAYNPLIPDGSNWKATFMIEYPDVAQRRRALEQLKDIERQVWAQVGDGDRIVAIANEDLDRSNEDKTAAVHFLRFELSAAQVDALRQDARLRFGISHPAMTCEAEVGGAIRGSLLNDLG